MGQLRRSSAQGSAGREGCPQRGPTSESEDSVLHLEGPTCLMGWLPGLEGAWEPGTVSRRANEKLGDQPASTRGPTPIHRGSGVEGAISG